MRMPTALVSFVTLTSIITASASTDPDHTHADHPSSSSEPIPDQSSNQGSPAVTRGPYLQTPTPNSIIIRWRTDTLTDSQVLYGTAPNQLTSSVEDPTLTTEHIVTLPNLQPNKQYYYSVGTTTSSLAGDDADHHFRTSPPPGTVQPVRIWVIGDSGIFGPDSRSVRDAYLNHTAHNPADLWITLGDNAYIIGTDSEYQNAMFNTYPSILRTTPMWSTLGNHDGFTANSENETGPYYDIMSFPRNGEAGGVASGTEAYYSFDYANIHFVTLDTYETDRSIGSPMLNWLSKDLAATDQTWLIAFFHHPPYSDGHISDDEVWSTEVRENILPMLEAAGVDLVLGGHSHSYERSQLLTGHYGLSSTLDSSMILDAGDGNEYSDGVYAKPTPGLAPNEGTVFAVTGNASQVTGDSLNHPAMPVSLLELGSMILDINNTRLDAISIDDQGNINDRFTITKGPQPCRVDLDQNDTLNFFDISAFITAFNKNEPVADFNIDGRYNFFDISQFLSLYAKGCP